MKKAGTIDKNNIDIQSIDCVLQHAKCLRKQALKGERADFGEPCAECIHREECGFDWFGKMRPLLDLSNVTIPLCSSEHHCTEDKHQ